MAIDFGKPVDPDEHAITAICEKASSIFAHLWKKSGKYFYYIKHVKAFIVKQHTEVKNE